MKKKHLAFLFIYVMLVCKAMVACYRIQGFNYIIVSLLFLAGIALYMIFSRLVRSRFFRPAFLLPLLAAAVAAGALLHEQLYYLWDISILQNFEGINHGIYTESETYFHQFLPFLIVLVPLTSALCWDNFKKGRAELSIAVMSVYLFSLWNNGLDKLMGRYVPYFILLSIIYLSICRYDKLVSSYRNTDVKVTVTFRNIMLYTLLTAIAVTSASCGASHVFGTKSIVRLRSDYDYREIQLENISKSSAFQLYGYGSGSKGGRLGGPIQLDTLIALKVRAEQPEYLRGTVKDYYDGQSWSKSIDEYAVKSLKPFITPNQGFNLIMTGSADRKPAVRRLTVYPYGLSTSTLFSPANALSLSAKGGKVIYDSYNSYMLLGKETVNESYTVKYYSSSTGVEIFDPGKWSGKEFSFDYSNDATVREQFAACLQIPQSISPRTYELVKRITADCRTTQEKAAAIMNYLKSNYSYSLNVSQVPEDVDFVEYFLYREKKGYCTYFATAATMMFRIAGIPARYVEGFNMDDEQDSSGLYLVRNHRAHAWTEILISPESNLWAVADCVPQGADIDDIAVSGQYRDRFDDDRYRNGNMLLAKDEESRYNNYSIPDYSALFEMLLYPVFIIPSSLLVCLSVYIIYKLMAAKRRLGIIMSKASIIPLYAHILSRLKTAGEEFPEECCELEYVKGLKDRELSSLLERLVKACYDEHYGGIIGNAAIDKKSFYRLFEKYMRKRQGFIRYWYYRIRY